MASDLKHKTPAELRDEIASMSKWRAQKEAEAAKLEQDAAAMVAEASSLRTRAHNLGQREAWARMYLAQKT